jgi:hypothetical protein
MWRVKDISARYRRSLSERHRDAGITCHCGSLIDPGLIELPHKPDAFLYDDVVDSLLKFADVPPTDRRCVFHRRLDDAHIYGAGGLQYDEKAVDGLQKATHMNVLTSKAGNICDVCGRRPDTNFPFRFFQFDHRTCRRQEAKTMPHLFRKMFSIGCMFIDFKYDPRTAAYRLNMELLKLPFSVARPLMEAEASKCRLLCVSCHKDITAAQNNTDYSWESVAETLRQNTVIDCGPLTQSACKPQSACEPHFEASDVSHVASSNVSHLPPRKLLKHLFGSEESSRNSCGISCGARKPSCGLSHSYITTNLSSQHAESEEGGCGEGGEGGATTGAAGC